MPPPPRIPPRIALKIDVHTHRTVRHSLPHLVDVLRRNRAGASFAVALGPDRSGRALNQIFQPERHGRAIGASLAAHFGLGGLLFGMLLPAPSIGRRNADLLRGVRDNDFEIAVAGWDALEWTSRAMDADAVWSARQLELATTAYEQLFAYPARMHAAPGWRSNPNLLRLTQRLGFTHASDCRGRHPFVPVWNGEIVRCPQFPTTLPTVDELAEGGKTDLGAVCAQLLALTASPPPLGHVFSLRAPPRPDLLDAFLEQLFAGWREQGYELTSVRTLAAACDMDKLPRHEVVVGTVPGRCGTVLMQGNEFLSEWRLAA